MTLGTDEHPFPRMLDLVAPLAATEEIVVQHGHTPPCPDSFGHEWLEWVGYDEVVRLMSAARVVIAHAGVGTIMTALQLGVTPVVVPRLHGHGEHVDDHQLQLARELGASGFVVPCLPDGDLEAAVEAAAERGQVAWTANGTLKRAVVLAAGGERA